jgi:hypothetical protein
MASNSGAAVSSSSSPLFEYDCEAVRVHANRFNTKSGLEEHREGGRDSKILF